VSRLKASVRIKYSRKWWWSANVALPLGPLRCDYKRERVAGSYGPVSALKQEGPSYGLRIA